MPDIGEPTVDMLSTAAGVAVVVWIITGVILRKMFSPETFDRIGGALACAVGVVIAELYMVATVDLTLSNVLQAALVGLFGGFLSQNVNSVITRLLPAP